MCKESFCERDRRQSITNNINIRFRHLSGRERRGGGGETEPAGWSYESRAWGFLSIRLGTRDENGRAIGSFFFINFFFLFCPPISSPKFARMCRAYPVLRSGNPAATRTTAIFTTGTPRCIKHRSNAREFYCRECACVRDITHVMTTDARQQRRRAECRTELWRAHDRTTDGVSDQIGRTTMDFFFFLHQFSSAAVLFIIFFFFIIYYIVLVRLSYRRRRRDGNSTTRRTALTCGVGRGFFFRQ